MKTVSIFEKKWIDLVFEGRNKEYGAYELRQENSKTTLTAFVYAVAFIVSVSGIGLLLSSFSSKPDVIICNLPKTPPVILTTFHPNIEKPKRIKQVEKGKSLPAVTDKILRDPILVKPDLVTDVIVKTTALNNTTTTEIGKGETGISTIPSDGTGGGGNDETGKDKDKSEIVTTVMLDKQPSFPGGMERFYDFVGKNYRTPDVELETTIKVFVSFVIEPDGSMTNIRVTRDPGYGLGKEAVRVLTSMKTKWEPGILDGQKVRTAFNLPIAVKVD